MNYEVGTTEGFVSSGKTH